MAITNAIHFETEKKIFKFRCAHSDEYSRSVIDFWVVVSDYSSVLGFFRENIVSKLSY